MSCMGDECRRENARFPIEANIMKFERYSPKCLKYLLAALRIGFALGEQDYSTSIHHGVILLNQTNP